MPSNEPSNERPCSSVPRRLIIRSFLLVATTFPLLAQAASQASASQATAKILRFESDVLPVFRANCLACHGDVQRQKGLDLRTRDSILKGGESGQVIGASSG